MGDHLAETGAVNLGPFVGADLNMRPAVYRADTDVKRITPNRSLPWQPMRVCMYMSLHNVLMTK